MSARPASWLQMVGSTQQLSRPLLTAIVAALLALHAWLALSATVDLGVTGDETVHLTGGYSYWETNDYRLHPENGNLPQRWAALPLVVHGANFQPKTWERDWAASDVWMMGQHFFFESGNPIDSELLWARAMMLFWSVGAGLLVYFWSRALWGEFGGLFSLALYTLSPTILAHAPLVTSDTCAAFWLVTATGAWWRLLEKPATTRLLLSLAAFSLACVSKFSAVLLIPVFVVLAGIGLLSRNIRPTQSWKTSGIRMIALLTLHGFVAGVVIWAFFGFRYSAFAPNSELATFFSPTAETLPPDGPMRAILLFALQHHLLPEGFLHGFTYVLFGAQQRAAFAAGEYSNTGWWWFFPFAFWVKSSLAELLTSAGLLALGVLGCLRRSASFRPRIYKLTPLLVFGSVYGAIALSSHLNIGQRHLLPLYLVLFVLAGALAAGAVRWLAVPGLILAIAATELVSIRPHYLAFFNCVAGGANNGRRLLGDSSLDWGQDLPQLKEWLGVNKRSDEQVYLSYFGCDDPFYRQLHPIELAPYFRFGRRAEISPLKAGVYCIGASMLQDAASPYRGPWTREHEALYQKLKRDMPMAYSINHYVTDRTEPGTLFWHFERARFARLGNYLRVRKPDAEIGHAIFVYRLSAAEIDAAVNGNLHDLAALIASAATK